MTTTASTVVEAQRDLSEFPWRFSPGDRIYFIGQIADTPYKVIARKIYNGFPHLILRDLRGHAWRVPQLHCSSKPISGL